MLAQHLSLHPLPGRPVPPENWHLTVRFLGNVGEVAGERLAAALDQADLGPAFVIALGGMGAFPRPARATVIWLALDKGRDRLTALNGLAEEAAQGAGLAPEDRPYAPHLTLSRIRPELDVRTDVASYAPVPFQWTAPALVLFESHPGRGGARYERVEEFPFDPGS